MGEGAIVDVWRNALFTVALVAAPFVLVALVVKVSRGHSSVGKAEARGKPSP